MLNLLDIIGMTIEPAAGGTRPFDLRGDSAMAGAGLEFTSLFEQMMASLNVLPSVEVPPDPVAAAEPREPQETEPGVDGGEGTPLRYPVAAPIESIIPLAGDEHAVSTKGASVELPSPQIEIVADGIDNAVSVRRLESPRVSGMSRAEPTNIVAAKREIHLGSELRQTVRASLSIDAALPVGGDVPPISDAGPAYHETAAPRSQPPMNPEAILTQSEPREAFRFDPPKQSGPESEVDRPADAPAATKLAKPVMAPEPIRFVPMEGQAQRPASKTQSLQGKPMTEPVVRDTATESEQPIFKAEAALPAHRAGRVALPPRQRAVDNLASVPPPPRPEPTVPKEALNYAPPMRPQILSEENKQTSRAKGLSGDGPIHIQQEAPLSRSETADNQPVVRSRPLEPVPDARFDRVAIRARGGDDSRAQAPPIVEGDFAESFRPADSGTVFSPGPHAPGVGQDTRSSILVSGTETLGKTIEHEVVGRLNRLESSSEEFTAEIRLQPRELGSVKIRISVSDHRVDLQLAVDSKEVRQLVQSHVSELRTVLEEKGYSLTDINVFVSAERDSSGGPDGRPDYDRFQSTRASTDQNESHSNSRGQVLTDKRVNLLV